jgi:Leucine rich repeat
MVKGLYLVLVSSFQSITRSSHSMSQRKYLTLLALLFVSVYFQTMYSFSAMPASQTRLIQTGGARQTHSSFKSTDTLPVNLQKMLDSPSLVVTDDNIADFLTVLSSRSASSWSEIAVTFDANLSPEYYELIYKNKNFKSFKPLKLSPDQKSAPFNEKKTLRFLTKKDFRQCSLRVVDSPADIVLDYSLEHLNLSQSNINDKDLLELSFYLRQFRNLKSLILNGNRLTSIPNGFFDEFSKSLVSVSLAVNQITNDGLPDNLFAKNPNLADIDLSYNSLSEFPTNQVANKHSLYKLYLSGNPITRFAPAIDLASIKNLQFLSIKQIEGIGKDQIKAVCPKMANVLFS